MEVAATNRYWAIAAIVFVTIVVGVVAVVLYRRTVGGIGRGDRD